MYCVIQEIKTKKPNKNGAYKTLEVYVSYNSNSRDKYNYRRTGDRFERLIKKAYKISLHESYREHGKIKKKQYSIGTVGYYDVAEWDLYSYCDRKIKSVADQLNIPQDNVYDLIYEKYSDLEGKIQQEFQQSVEYKTDKKHTEIIQKYIRDKADFADKYHVSDSEYDYCYNVFGVVVNQEYLKQIIENAKAYEENQKNSYYNSDSSNYSNYDLSFAP